MWRVSVLTLFPDIFPGPLGASLAGKALQAGVWSLDAVDIRAFATRQASHRRRYAGGRRSGDGHEARCARPRHRRDGNG